VLVPELTVQDPAAAARVLGAFGFASSDGLWCLGSQAVSLRSGSPRGHGRIDHVALSVPDIDAAVATLAARGVALADVTPKGPEFIPEFWDDGLRFVYFSGPEGARIELCQRVSGGAAEVGHDHIGIPCQDLPAMQAFFLAQGATLIAAVELSRPEGMIPVRFLRIAGGVVELFQPRAAERSIRGLWSRILIPGLAAPVDGPEGLTLAPL
jgi:catechol 2,3-dioxygenase-like lactoylglutathione lyase family enzyme